jgi:uncharacterized protein YndB with AHSA1/START domain
MNVIKVDAGPRQVSRSVVVGAPAEELFALLADPRRHGEVDGSGTVQATVSGPERLSPGATFSVRMRQRGFRYRIRSRVTRFEEGRVIEWRHPVGHHWRWEFEPLTDGTTRVTETFDYSRSPGGRPKVLYYEKLGFAGQNARGIEATLTALEARYPV